MAPVTILVVDKSGNIKDVSLKSYDESELYKKAGLKTAEGFKCYAEWNIEELNNKAYSISVFGKTTGKANQENKYDFPPPIDTTLFFGSCIIVNKCDEKAVSITEDEWESVYEYLFGGFEDIGDQDSDESEDDDDDVPRTKEGYVKDDFVVDDDEDDYDDDDDDDEEEEEDEDDDDEEIYTKKTKKTKKVEKPKAKKESEKKGKKTATPANVFTNITESESYLDCTSELSEEEYIE
jgi:hypothetical protein